MRRTVFALAASAAVLASTVFGVTPARAASSSNASSLLSSNGSVGYSITFLSASQNTSLRGRWNVGSLVSTLPRRVAAPVGAVPEPTAMLAFGAGALVIAAALRRRRA
jgi:hypothetical protein